MIANPTPDIYWINSKYNEWTVQEGRDTYIHRGFTTVHYNESLKNDLVQICNELGCTTEMVKLKEGIHTDRFCVKLE